MTIFGNAKLIQHRAQQHPEVVSTVIENENKTIKIYFKKSYVDFDLIEVFTAISQSGK